MKMVVVGGNSREIGKTSVMAGIIRALPHHEWLAIKLTQFGHGVCSVDGHECHCASGDHPFAILEERDRRGMTDSSRFLVAGARRSLWVRVRWGMLETVIPRLRQAIEGEEHVIIESNSILQFFQPNVYLTVLEPAKKDFKISAQKFLGRADAFLSLSPNLESHLWEDISFDELRTKPVFSISRDAYVTPEIAEFVEARLTSQQSAQYVPA
jgi:hypothetical protein